MPFCPMCGTQLGDTDRFCAGCGAPSQPTQPPQPQSFPIDFYSGQERKFTLMGRELTVSAGMDTFNHYRKEFRTFARKQTAALEAEYRARIYNLDAFLVEFPTMYARYRKPLLDCAMSIILKSGVFDISAKQFEDQHTADFCL